MGQAKKKILHRKAAQVYKHLMSAIEGLIELRDYFGEFHSDWAAMFQVVLDSLMMLMQTLERLYTIAWGYFPDDINTWLK